MQPIAAQFPDVRDVVMTADRCCRRPLGALLALFLSVSSVTANAGEITVACWNVENLFDTRKDTNEAGEPVLSADSLKLKMTKIAEVIKYLKPDVMGLIEVENIGLLRTLVANHLAGEGYDYLALIEQTDPRGIDMAVLSRIPLTAYSFDVAGHTRGVLACRISVRGEPFYVLVNHWKSRIGGGEEIRMSCARRTLELVTDVLPRYEGRKVPTLVVGDFNDDDSDASVMALERGGLTNALKRLAPADRWSYPWWDSARKRVHYHAFDHIFANENMSDGTGIDLVPNSARVVRPTFMQRKRRLNGAEHDWIDDSFGDHIGYSDHYPVSVQLRGP